MPQKTSKRPARCEWCKEPALDYHRAHTYRFLESGDISGTRTEHALCLAHYLECEFGLLPWVCTKACQKRRGRSSDARLLANDHIVWIVMEQTLAREGLRTSPKCPWCGKRMHTLSLRRRK